MSLNKYDFNHKDTYLLLGPQEVGKTCFLAGMYYTFRTLNGYGLSCTSEEQSVALNAMCDDFEKGIFPSGTGGTTSFDFRFRFAHKQRFAFEWFDYRGKMLGEYGLIDQREYDDLVNVVNNSTCILICVDGTWLSHDKNESVKQIQDKSYAINELLNKYVDSNKILPPICVVITKIDLCDMKYEKSYYEAIKESFPFFESKDTPIYICPICIGKKDEETGMFSFNPTDKDVYRPLFYALWCGYSYRIAGLKENLKRQRKIYKPMMENLEHSIKKMENRVVIINKEKRINSKKQDLNKLKNVLQKEEARIAELEREQSDLLEKISGSENIYWGNIETTWEEVEKKWKFFR